MEVALHIGGQDNQSSDTFRRLTHHSCYVLQAARTSGEQSPTWKWRYILAGGAPPVDQSLTVGKGDILVTGHRDGRVRLWDACAEVRTCKAAADRSATLPASVHSRIFPVPGTAGACVSGKPVQRDIGTSATPETYKAVVSCSAAGFVCLNCNSL